MSIAPPPIKNKKSFWGEPQAIATIAAAVIAAIATIVVALIGGDVINVSAGPAIQPPSSTTVPPSSSGPPPAPTTTAPPPDPTPPATVRRSTEDNPLTLSTGYSADLDTMNRSWDVEYAATLSRFDIDLGTGVGVVTGSESDIAIVDGPALYETCADATGYVKRIPRDELRQGVTACVRTSEKRLASVTIKKVTPRDSPNQIQLDVTVWDPPFEE